jgi:hypothetical protein
MRSRTLVPAALVLAMVGSLAHAGDSCVAPCAKVPKERRYVSTPGAIPLPPGIATLLTTPAATLAQGLKKRVLVVDATMTTGGLAPLAPFIASMVANVNGVPMEPVGSPFGPIMDCGGTGMSPLPPMFGCTLTASFWMDLDQAEAASPGVFIKQPLTVTLSGGNVAGGGGMPVLVSMGVHLEKNK